MSISWTTEQSTAPTAEPITLAELKDHLRISDANDDDDLTIKLAAARRYAEQFIGRQIMTATWKLYLSAFPTTIQLPYPPISSVTSIVYIDTGGTSQTLAATEYLANVKVEPGQITEAYGKTWPSLRSNQYNSVIVEYVSGYASASIVPDPIKQAIMAYAATLYEHREDVLVGAVKSQIPEVAVRLLWPYRTFFEVPWL